MSVDWITHKGKILLYVNYEGMGEQQMIDNLEQAYKAIMEAPGKVQVLNNFHGVYIGSAFMARAKELGKPQGERKATKMAALGIEGLKGIFMQAYNSVTGAGLRPFKSDEEAKDWLVE